MSSQPDVVDFTGSHLWIRRYERLSGKQPCARVAKALGKRFRDFSGRLRDSR